MKEIRVTIEALEEGKVNVVLHEQVVLLDGDDLMIGEVEQAIDEVIAEAWPEEEEEQEEQDRRDRLARPGEFDGPTHAVCDCEHKTHFAHTLIHEYGALRTGVESTKTSMGTFNVCKACRDAGHMVTA